jgi:hypothetical protein
LKGEDVKINIEATKEELDGLVAFVGGVEDAVEKIKPMLDNIEKITGPLMPSILPVLLDALKKRLGGEK